MHKLIKEENFIQRHQELERFKRRQSRRESISWNWHSENTMETEPWQGKTENAWIQACSKTQTTRQGPTRSSQWTNCFQKRELWFWNSFWDTWIISNNIFSFVFPREKKKIDTNSSKVLWTSSQHMKYYVNLFMTWEHRKTKQWIKPFQDCDQSSNTFGAQWHYVLVCQQ